MNLHSIDVACVIAYFMVVLAIGLYFARRRAGTEEYFLAGRRLGWMPIGFSLFASNISGSTLIGLCGAAYVTGISVSNYEWMAAVVLVFFAIFFAPYYIGSKVYTMPEFLERRYQPAVRYYFSLLTIVSNVFVDVAGSLYGGALVVSVLFPEVPLVASALVLALVAGLYTAAGGLSAVVYTDTIQAVIILIGTTAITFIALGEVGSWQAVVDATPSEMLSVVRPYDDPTLPWTGLLTGVPILGFYFWCTNQFIVQRVLGARDLRHARWGALFAGLLKLPVLFVMVFPGLMARQIFPGLENGDTVFPTLIGLLPVGLKGIMLAGLVAAIMSSVDSTLNSASTLVTMDFIKKFRPRTTDEALAWMGRGITVAIMIVSAAWTPAVARWEGLFTYLQTVISYIFPPVVALFIVGLFWRRANGKGGFAGLIAGHSVAILFLITEPDIHFLNIAGILFAISCTTVVIVSLLSSPPSDEQIDQYVYSRSKVQAMTADLPPLPWYQDYRYLAAGLMALTAWLVVANW